MKDKFLKKYKTFLLIFIFNTGCPKKKGDVGSGAISGP